MSLCPDKYFVPLCNTISQPNNKGFYRTGVANVLSQTEIRLNFLAIVDIFYISHTFNVGFVGVSKIISLVELLIALIISSCFEKSTKVNLIPNFLKILFIKRLVPP